MENVTQDEFNDMMIASISSLQSALRHQASTLTKLKRDLLEYKKFLEKSIEELEKLQKNES